MQIPAIRVKPLFVPYFGSQHSTDRLMKRRLVVIALVALVATSRDAICQAGISPSAEAGVGYGTGNGGSYANRDVIDMFAAASLRFNTSSARAWYLEGAGIVRLFQSGVTDCLPLPASCVQDFPNHVGLTVSAGLVASVKSWLEMRAGVGGGVMHFDSHAVPALTGQLDVAAFPVKRVGLVVGTRPLVFTSKRNIRISRIPIVMALRVR
jgi:hypothetical protein